MRLLQLSFAGFRLLAAGEGFEAVAGHTNVSFGVVIGKYFCV
jgi:hypothetical protein